MSALRDMKALGLPPERQPMPAPLRATCAALVAIIALGTAWGLVADEPDRRAVTVHTEQITMTRQQLADLITAARIAAAREAFDAKECRPGDEFKFPPRKRI